jgi:hypothetical protein
MTERTDELIRELSHGLHPVRRIPPLRRVGALVAGLAGALVLAQFAYDLATGAHVVKSGFGAVDAQTLVAHVLLAAGALGFALGASVPGREVLARVGAIAVGLALVAIAGIGCERLLQWPGLASLAPDWVRATFACGAGSIAPALLPALVLSRFSARAAPRHAARVLVVGAAAPIAILTWPGILGCGYPDELHHVTAHLLAPALGALVLALLVLPVVLAARRSVRD